MKTLNLFLILICAIFTQTIQSQTVSQAQKWQTGRNDYQIKVENVNRDFIVSIPQSYTGKEAFPVVLMFHGTSGTGEKFYNISGWKEKGEQEGIITVFPTALKYCYIDEGKEKHQTKWNDGKLETYICSGMTLKDDVLFVREILAKMRQHLKMDDSRIYASGFSNGAGFVSRLAVELSDELAAVVVVAGGLQPQITAAPKAFIPIWVMAGHQDDRFIAANGGQPLPYQPADIEQSPLFRNILGRFLTKFELSEQYTSIERPHQMVLTFEENVNPVNDNLLIFSLVKGLKHNYPNGKNHPLKGAKIFWEFFKRYSK